MKPSRRASYGRVGRVRFVETGARISAGEGQAGSYGSFGGVRGGENSYYEPRTRSQGDGEAEDSGDEGDTAWSSPGRGSRKSQKEQWSSGDPDGYFDGRDEDGGDYWEFFPQRGMLRRHHVTPRLELFGHSAASEAVWEVADVSRDHLLPRRRTTILKLDEQGSVFHIHDYWTHFLPEDQLRPTVCDDLWVGFTDFAVPGREPLEFMPPFDPHSGLSNPPMDDEEAEEAEDAGVSSTASPDSQEIDPPEEVENDGQRGTWLTCGTTMLGCLTEAQ